MTLIRLYHEAELGQLRVAGLMSRKGTNLRKIILHEQILRQQRKESPYHVAVIFSDNSKSNANEIGSDFSIPVFTYDLESYCEKRDESIRDLKVRKQWEKECMKVLNEFECTVAAYAGYMRKATSVFVNSFIGVNVHPADLTIKGEDKKPKYRGDHVVLDAIRAGEKEIRSTTHLVSNKVDCGKILMVSSPIKVKYPISDDPIETIAGDYQDKLKKAGDWIIFPKTLEYLADGRFAQNHQNGRLYFDGTPIPNGVKLE
ncbi:MAG: formyltransferase family protein [Nanoarchaeota archaeon]